MGVVRRSAGAISRCVAGDRRPAILQPSRHRSHCRGPRGLDECDPGHGHPGRQYDHAAVGEEPVLFSATHVRAEAQGVDCRVGPGGEIPQTGDPRKLCERDLSRAGRVCVDLWSRGGRAPVFRQTCGCIELGGDRAAGRHDQGAEYLFTPEESGAGQAASRCGAGPVARTGARERRRVEAGGDDAGQGDAAAGHIGRCAVFCRPSVETGGRDDRGALAGRRQGLHDARPSVATAGHSDAGE